MGGLSPETWPVLGAFLILQTLITWPLVKYIRESHKSQLDDLRAQVEAWKLDRDSQLAMTRAIYQASIDYAQKRGDTLHAEKEKLIAQLDANSQQMYRAVEALAELREAVRDLTKVRQSA